MPNDNQYRLVTLPALRVEFGVLFSRSQLAKLEQSGDFPCRLKLAPRRIAWRASDVQAWIESKAAAAQHRPRQSARIAG